MLKPNETYVIEEDGSIHRMRFCGDADWEERATTSIQEIKNQVIDEFVANAEEWNNNIKSIRNEEAFFTIENIRKIAEQMKGE